MSAKSNIAKDTVEILTVEDSPTQAEQLRYILEQHGYRVTLARDGRQALAFLSEHKPSLVISDINMPEMNGYELCQRIKGDERARGIPVILLTSLSDPADVLEGLACGADSFITKPYSADYLLAHVERILAARSSRPSLRAGVDVEIQLADKSRVITADPQQMLSLLLSTYEAAVHRNTELAQTQDELSALNEHLEGLVKERTAALSTEITKRKRAEEQIQKQVETLSMLYDLSRTLSEMENFNAILNLLTRQAVETTHVTFARVLLLENGDLVVRAAFPVRALDQDLQVGQREPLVAHPFCQRILKENTPQVIQLDNPEGDECAPFFLDIAQTLCIIPLRTRERPLGLLMLGEERNTAREPFSADKMNLARSIGDQATSTLHRALLHEETQRRLHNLKSLRDIEFAISGSLDLHLTLSVILEQVVNQLGVDAADILLLKPHTQTLEFTAGRGFRGKGIERTRLRLGEGHAGRAALERHLISLDDLRKEIKDFVQGNLLAGEDFDCYHCAPLIAKGQIKGVLEVYLRTHRILDAESLDFFETLASQIAIAVDNANLFDSLQRSNIELALAYNTTLEGWAKALELRDQETNGHSQRVTEMTLDIGRSMGMSEEQLVHVQRGALLHDMGKMGIPDSILLKPDKLTEEEWVIMRQHPQFAYDMFFPIEYLRPALDIPYCHHEKWDGSGYPQGLKGEEIPLTARIFAAVDVYDALISDRPYRKAWTKETALKHIEAGSGSHFDPKVVEMFLRLQIKTPLQRG